MSSSCDLRTFGSAIGSSVKFPMGPYASAASYFDAYAEEMARAAKSIEPAMLELAAATRRAVVAFQADDLDLGLRSGWSVTVVGRCDEVTDTADLARLDKLGLESWAPGTRNHFIRIEPGIVTGRRLISRDQHG